MEPRDFKDFVYGHFAKISKALSSPRRFEILDYLSHAPKTVEKLAKETNMSVANTSQHLQSLLEAKIVKFTKDKNFVYYSLADDKVIEALRAIRNLAETRSPDIEYQRKEYIERNDKVNVVQLEGMLQELQEGEAILIDVRPEEEYAAQHIPGAMSIPLHELENRMSSLPQDKKIIAYCRGPYCLFATQAVEVLHSFGYEAYRIEEGVNEMKHSNYIH